MARTLPPKPKAPPMVWGRWGGDVRLHPFRARIGRWLRSFIADTAEDDAWLDRQAEKRLASRSSTEAA